MYRTSRCSGSSAKSTWKSAWTPNSVASRNTISTCARASLSLYGQPPTRSAPSRSARSSSASVPGICKMPSWAKAQSCSSIAGRYSSRSGTSASRALSSTMGSTSTWLRIAVVPWLTAMSSTARARARMSSTVKRRLARPVTRIASSSVPSTPGARSDRSALSRWIWASTSPDVTARAPHSTSRCVARPLRVPSSAFTPSRQPMSVARPSASRQSRKSRSNAVTGPVTVRVRVQCALEACRRNPALEPAPVALPFQAHDAAEAGCLEVAGRDEDLLALEPLDERAPRLARQLRVHVRARDPVRLLELHRGMGGIAENEGPFSAGGDQDAHVARRVPGRRHRGQLGRDAVLAVHQLDEPELLERPDACGCIGKARGLHVRPMTCLPVHGAHPVPRFGKRGHVRARRGREIPADVVAVEMGHDHHVHL